MDTPETVLRELERLRGAVSEHEARLARLEAAAALPSPPATERAAAYDSEVELGDLVGKEWTDGLPARIGRLIVILGGAFLLRALTDSGTVGAGIGVALGLLYAMAWTGMAARAGRARRKADATFYGLATTIIAFPLLVEATLRMNVFGAAAAAGTLLVCALAILAVAWMERLGAMAWIATLGSTATGVGLLFTTHALPPFVLALFLTAAASLAISFHREWYFLRWPAAIALDALVAIGMVMLGREGYEWLSPGQLAVTQVLLTVMYLGILAVRTLVLGHPMREFGIVQSLLVFALGFEGAQHVLAAGGAGAPLFPIAALAAAGACYAVSFLRLERMPDQRMNFAWYVTLGTIFLIASLARLLPLPVAGLAWSATALIAAFGGRTGSRAALRWCAALLAAAAAAGSGLATGAGRAFLLWKAPTAATFDLIAWSTSIVLLLAWLVLRWREQEQDHTIDWSVPGMALLVTCALDIGAGVVSALVTPLALSEAGALAVLRTGVLVAAALALALASKLRARAELGWTVYTLLALTAFKLLLEDVVRGSPLSICFSLVFFGCGMILAPRMVSGASMATALPGRAAPPATVGPQG